MEKRMNKIKEFEKFYDNCKSTFEKFGNNDDRVNFFKNKYTLCICPGGRTLEKDKRIVEIFFAQRPYDFVANERQKKILVEAGATLFFYRNDTGDIIISLYPATTEFREPIESYIFLYNNIDSEKLNNEKFIKSLWNDFTAYMEVTSLDGKPTVFQQLRISYLRHFKHLVVGNKFRPTKFHKFCKEVLKWVLTVGLSGIIVYAVTTVTQPKTTEIENQLKNINRRLETISCKLGSVSEDKVDISEVSTTLDSIDMKASKILKQLELKKK